MDAQRLRVLREFADRGSVAATAGALHCTPSAVSQQLKALQHETRLPLLARSGRRLVLTEAGQALARAAVGVTEALERAEAVLADFRAGTRVTVHAAFFPSGAEMLLPGTLRWLGEHAPGVRLESHPEEPVWQEFERLTADYDVVVAHSAFGAHVWSEAVVAHRLFREPLDIAVPIDHPLADRSWVTAEEVTAYPWIGVPDDYPFHNVIARIEERAGRTIDVVQRYPDLRTMEALITQGLGIGLLSRFTARHGNGRQFLLKPLKDVDAGRTLAVLMRPERVASPGVARVVEGLAAVGEGLAREDLGRTG